MKGGSDLFTAALDARDRRIAKLEQDLADARDHAAALRAELDERTAGLVVTGERVALFPSTRRAEYVAKAIDQVARLARPEARESVVRQRVDDTFARLIRYGVAEDAARADAEALGLLLRSATGVPSTEGGRGA